MLEVDDPHFFLLYPKSYSSSLLKKRNNEQMPISCINRIAVIPLSVRPIVHLLIECQKLWRIVPLVRSVPNFLKGLGFAKLICIVALIAKIMAEILLCIYSVTNSSTMSPTHFDVTKSLATLHIMLRICIARGPHL